MILIDSLLHISFRISHPGALYDGCVESYRKNKLDIQTKSARYPAARVTPRITLQHSRNILGGLNEMSGSGSGPGKAIVQPPMLAATQVVTITDMWVL